MNNDFSGMATVYGVLCNDGRTIKPGAFDHQHGQTVPLVWRHNHKDITNVLGHGVLQKSESPPGIRVVGVFNDSKEGKQARTLVKNGDISSLSIWANEIEEQVTIAQSVESRRREVDSGRIREVSLVLNGANPGAKIDDYLRHSDDPDDFDGFVVDGILVHTDEDLEIFEDDIEDDIEDLEIEEEEEEEEEENEDDEDDEVWSELLSHPTEDDEDDGDFEHSAETVGDILETLTPEQAGLFDHVLYSIATGETTPRSEDVENGTGPTYSEVLNTLSHEQTQVLHYLAGSLGDSEDTQSIQQGDQIMSNIFEQQGQVHEEENVLTHEAVHGALTFAAERRVGSLREVFNSNDIHLAHNISHSITDIDNMFPDAKAVTPGGPEFYSRPMEWVEKVLGGTNKRPFSRIKSWYADLTPDAARAKGYVTAALKVEEVIAVLKRTTTPQTIYKLQKLDRDDILDITDFDVVVWLKGEMRLMLREELAGAILISDRRSAGADKIVETNVRPIYNDSDVFTVKFRHNDVGNEQALSAFTDAELIDLIDGIASQMRNYRGAGSPTFYCSPEVKSAFMLIRDADNHRLHPTTAVLAAALGVKDVVEVPVMSNFSTAGVVDPSGTDQAGAAIPAGTYTLAHLGVIVNLSDYVVGMDRGGQTSFFDDFDIDYNKYTYLYETRLSGALIHPMSAIAVDLVTAKTA